VFGLATAVRGGSRLANLRLEPGEPAIPAGSTPAELTALDMVKRAESAWKNYHAMVCAVRHRIYQQGLAEKRGGVGMMVELTHSGSHEGQWMGNVCHVSCGLSAFVLRRLHGSLGGECVLLYLVLGTTRLPVD
jgi:hypothetical protein